MKSAWTQFLQSGALSTPETVAPAAEQLPVSTRSATEVLFDDAAFNDVFEREERRISRSGLDLGGSRPSEPPPRLAIVEQERRWHPLAYYGLHGNISQVFETHEDGTDPSHGRAGNGANAEKETGTTLSPFPKGKNVVITRQTSPQGQNK